MHDCGNSRKKPVVPDSSLLAKSTRPSLQAVSRGIGWEFAFHVSPPPKNLAIFERELRAAGFAPPLPDLTNAATAAAAQRHAMRRWVFDVVRSRDERGKLRKC